ncbi:MAG: hypothetical protein IT579_05720 [Verrucomicrobia subdivision 3 bacterium]|nr:hypothetical protein [Limisphaerales bacterium]
MKPTQAFLGFEQAAQDAELAAANARLQAKLAAQAQRAIRKRQEEMDKNTRRWKREEKTRAKNDTLTAQCGINWYSRRRDAGIFWTHCRTCGQELIYTDDPHAKPQACAGRKL